ncbi:MAG TPA: hypothetical protein VFM77_15935, partial [Terriglobales bacterium]|nr:hypothetical protein [Terriglobales bacterium]
DDSVVCIGDFWAASEGLDDLIIRIGRMIAYQEYNTKSPLNGLAAKWAAQNPQLLPVDPRPIAPPLKATDSSSSIAAAPAEDALQAAVQDAWAEKIVISEIQQAAPPKPSI